MYCMFLNTQGRVMFDTFIIKKTPSQYFIDCDNDKKAQLAKHLKLHKVRRKLVIEVIPDCKIGAIFDTEYPLEELTNSSGEYYKDSRMNNLGYRVIDPSSEFQDDSEDFVKHRYALGICEGSKEVPLGKCTPLEYNVEYMHGVSFHKGCYIGQELTARTHHTGVIRKRIVPIQLSSAEIEVKDEMLDVRNEDKKKVGKICATQGNIGLGLMRIEDCLKAEKLCLSDKDVSVKFEIPDWWPISAPKTPQNR